MGKSVVVVHTNKTHFNSRQKSTFYFSNINMKPFIALSALAAAAMAAPTADPQYAGPVHAAVGDLVATRRGYRPVSLEGFSEDDNQDGFVDPVGQVAPVLHHPVVAPYAAPLLHHAPLVAAAPLKVEEVKVEAPKVEKVELPAPVVSYHAAPLYHHGYAAAAPAPLLHSTYTVPVTQTHITHHPVSHTQTIPLGVQRRVVTTHHVAGAPIVTVGAAAAAPAEAEVTEA